MLQSTEEQNTAETQQFQRDIRKFTGDNSILVFPRDHPERGKVGFIVYKQYHKNGQLGETSFVVERIIGPPADIVIVESAAEFKTIIDDAVAKDFPIEPCDEIPMMRRGVIITKHTGRIIYRIDAKKLRKTSTRIRDTNKEGKQ